MAIFFPFDRATSREQLLTKTRTTNKIHYFHHLKSQNYSSFLNK